MLNDTLEIIKWIIIGVETLCALVLVVYYTIKAIKNKWVNQLVETINNAIKEAEEKYPEGHGDEKKALVINAVAEKCEELGIPFSLIKLIVSDLIDRIVADHNVFVK